MSQRSYGPDLVVGSVHAAGRRVAKLDVERRGAERQRHHGQHSVVERQRQQRLTVRGRHARPLLGVVRAAHVYPQRVLRVVGEAQLVLDERNLRLRQHLDHCVVDVRIGRRQPTQSEFSLVVPVRGRS